jgi:hypothetical protein
MESGAPERDIPRQREIIDRRVLSIALDGIARDESLNGDKRRARVLETLKIALTNGARRDPPSL